MYLSMIGTHEVICAAYELWRKNKEDREEYQGYKLFYAYSIYHCHITRMLFSVKKILCIGTNLNLFQMDRSRGFEIETKKNDETRQTIF
jgi:hypothetical protein